MEETRMTDEPIVLTYQQYVDLHLDFNIDSGQAPFLTQFLTQFNKKGWNWNPVSMDDPIPAGLPEAHHRLFSTCRVIITVGVDKNGNKRILDWEK